MEYLKGVLFLLSAKLNSLKKKVRTCYLFLESNWENVVASLCLCLECPSSNSKRTDSISLCFSRFYRSRIELQIHGHKVLCGRVSRCGSGSKFQSKGHDPRQRCHRHHSTDFCVSLEILIFLPEK